MTARSAVAAITGRTPVDVRRLSGGDTAAAFAVSLDDGAVVFAKTAPGSMPGAIAAEAASLRWLAEPGSVAVPEVLGNSERWLVTEHIAEAAPTAAAAEQLGRGLAELHATGAPAFGAAPPGGPVDAWIGLAPMRNESAPDWPSFYATHRIEPYLRKAVDSGVLSTADGSVISRVCADIDRLAGPAEPPARLHGDLWSGNVRWGNERAWLIDPAAHGGHRETDLAMLHLFGCPHLDRIVAAYEETRPLAEGWRDRIALHQLFPLLVHAVLFGSGYAAQAVSAARSALRTR
ncbi:Fructosamine-3-kinase [Saccharopolyspora antimicrobica]|uniref:Fructosamine-3-kinase n=1 Tax=Saccharopolyspora antimicrobica TaxID=455193 RepID=A0A1I4YAI7_9PSEU|nr:fructosamine kinase family protein [Saccharopolyspora antimicrobica]RKT82590.1 fructosamine-3-kinase [Saccharopolyspora antimicrobica]SFN35052.1 Fructosamine-3-kinase [Saccharopolyspora antimicrobica]